MTVSNRSRTGCISLKAPAASSREIPKCSTARQAARQLWILCRPRSGRWNSTERTTKRGDQPVPSGRDPWMPGRPVNPVEVAYFDTAPFSAEVPGFFDGSWSNYPFFESGNILVTSHKQGLFLLKRRVPIS